MPKEKKNTLQKKFNDELNQMKQEFKDLKKQLNEEVDTPDIIQIKQEFNDLKKQLNEEVNTPDVIQIKKEFNELKDELNQEIDIPSIKELKREVEKEKKIFKKLSQKREFRWALAFVSALTLLLVSFAMNNISEFKVNKAVVSNTQEMEFQSSTKLVNFSNEYKQQLDALKAKNETLQLEVDNFELAREKEVQKKLQMLDEQIIDLEAEMNEDLERKMHVIKNHISLIQDHFGTSVLVSEDSVIDEEILRASPTEQE